MTQPAETQQETPVFSPAHVAGEHGAQRADRFQLFARRQSRRAVANQRGGIIAPGQPETTPRLDTPTPALTRASFVRGVSRAILTFWGSSETRILGSQSPRVRVGV